jgi:formylglycine-generating enzyme required for sulfatase activity
MSHPSREPRRFSIRLQKLWLVVCAALAAASAGLTLSTPVAADDQPSSRPAGAGASSPAASNESYLQFAGEKAGQLRDDNGLKLKLLWCPPGMFTMEGISMGDFEPAPPIENPKIDLPRNDDVVVEDEVPAEPPVIRFRRVEQVTRVKTFLRRGYWLGKYEVTEAEWKQVLGTEPWKGEDRVNVGDEYPATYVTWDDATEFCSKLTEQERNAGRLSETWEYTLPTEAQWERACRARTEGEFSFDNGKLELGDFAWYSRNSAPGGGRQSIQQVGRKQPNPWGLCDMHGNVWEWCRDCFREGPPGGLDPEVTTDGPGRAFRGGSYDDSPLNCRSASRKRNLPSWRGSDIGFRVALCAKR